MATTTSLTYNTSFQGFTMDPVDKPGKFNIGGAVDTDLNGPSVITVTYSEFEQLFGGMNADGTLAVSAKLNELNTYIKSNTNFNEALLAKFNAASETNVQWKTLTVGDTSAWFSGLVTDLKDSYAGVEFIPGNSLQLVVNFTVANLGSIINLGWTLQMV